jgi:spore maturation protein CgeB
MGNQLIVEESIKRIDSRSGLPIIKVRGESGKWVTLHSMIDPEKESRIMADNFNVSDDKIAVILGLGMGYHLFEILSRESKCSVIVVEKNEEIYETFLSEYADDERLAGRQIIFVNTENYDAAIEKISKFQIENGFKPFRVIEHIPSVRAFPSFYLELKSRIESMGKINIGSKMNYVKFKDEKVKILILHSKYYLLPEMINSIKSLGHEHKVVMVRGGRDGEGTQEVLENILSEIISFKPDFVLTVNHLGFDREGVLTGLFTDIKLPYASWYVDSPVFILDAFNKQISPYLSLFLWDSDYIDDLKNIGFENITYLPLATDTSIFNKIPASKNKLQNLKCDVGFVGSSGEFIINECLDTLERKKDIVDLLDKAAQQFLISSERHLRNVDLDLNRQERTLFEFLMDKEKKSFEPAVTWKASQLYRLSCLKETLAYHPHIHGDPGWSTVLNSNSVILPELNYYDELPSFYNVCDVNFNSTSLQMKTGFNQRIFDVPACGAFILTDYRAQLEEHFEIGKEVICYRDIGEINDLISFYLKNDLARNKIVENAFLRIKKDHTYINRIEFMINRMKEIYA